MVVSDETHKLDDVVDAVSWYTVMGQQDEEQRADTGDTVDLMFYGLPVRKSSTQLQRQVVAFS